MRLDWRLDMEKVTGIGGFFFRAKDPDALAKWYETYLGINPVPKDLETPPWTTQAGVTVFAPFSEDTDYFSKESRFMINFRVSNMDAMLAQLSASGVSPTNDQVMEGLGRFVHINDPEGNPIELWEPA
jgi:predicted enzyme related to lactoylglutathione lyase